jgi:hypothetical protein
MSILSHSTSPVLLGTVSPPDHYKLPCWKKTCCRKHPATALVPFISVSIPVCTSESFPALLSMELMASRMRRPYPIEFSSCRGSRKRKQALPNHYRVQVPGAIVLLGSGSHPILPTILARASPLLPLSDAHPQGSSLCYDGWSS